MAGSKKIVRDMVRGSKGKASKTQDRMTNINIGKLYGPAKHNFVKAMDEFKKMDDVVIDCYRMKGLRAWHDHLLLHLQKFVYAVFFTIAGIMLVVQGDKVKGDVCQIPDLYGILKFCVYPMYLDLGIVTINVIFLAFRALKGEEKILEAILEPRVQERLLIHLFPLFIVVLLAVTAHSVPMCYLTTEYRDSGFCKVFRADVVKGCLIAIAILLFVHLFTNVYHHRKLTKEIDLRGIHDDKNLQMDLYSVEPLLDASSRNPNDGLFMKHGYR